MYRYLHICVFLSRDTKKLPAKGKGFRLQNNFTFSEPCIVIHIREKDQQ